MVNQIKILIVDDQRLLRDSLTTIIDNEPDLSVVGHAANGQDAIEEARQTLPDIILMDIRMPGLNGIEATRAITNNPSLKNIRILALTMFEVDEYVEAALRAGAVGFLLKDSSPAYLTECIRRAANGEQVYATSVMNKLVSSYLTQTNPQPTQPPPGLTAREVEVLTLIGKGLSNQEITEELVVSMGTVKTHVGNLLMKLAARDRAQLVIFAYRHNLVQ